MTTLIDEIRQVSQQPQIIPEKNDADPRALKMFEQIKSGLHDKILAVVVANNGQTQALILEFKPVNYQVWSVIGSLVTLIQEYLDVDNYDKKGPTFYVYVKLSRPIEGCYSDNTLGIFVNWDRESWSRIKYDNSMESNLIYTTYDD